MLREVKTELKIEENLKCHSTKCLKRTLKLVKLFILDQNVRKSLNLILTTLNFLRLPVFKIMQFKISRFPLTSVLPVFQYCDRLILQKLAYIY